MRFGVIGTGFIVDLFLAAAASCEGFVLDAVYSRSAARSAQFAAKYGAAHVYESLDAFFASPAIDAVYVASPTCLHHAHAMAAMAQGKHVLCEKPAASNSAELAELLAAAKANGVLFLEGMRHLFAPSFAVIQRLLPRLGPIRRASFVYNQYSSRYDKFKAGVVENAFDPALSNGALMDIGVYCVALCAALFGRPQAIQSAGVKLANGLDGQGAILAAYPGMLAELSYSKICDAAAPSTIQGEDAALLWTGMTGPATVTLVPKKGACTVYACGGEENNLGFELAAFLRMARGPRGADDDGAARYHGISRLTMALLDEARRQQAIVFPADGCRAE